MRSNHAQKCNRRNAICNRNDAIGERDAAMTQRQLRLESARPLFESGEPQALGPQPARILVILRRTAGCLGTALHEIVAAVRSRSGALAR